MKINQSEFKAGRCLWLVLAFAGIAACSGGKQKGSISGEIRGVEGNTIYLQRMVNNKLVTTDSTVAGSDGAFTIVPSQPLSMDFYKLVLSKDAGITIITDSSESLQLKGDLEDLSGTIKASGSTNTECLRELELECAPLNKKDQDAVAKLRDPKVSDEEKAKYKQQLVDNKKKRTDIIRKWLDNNSQSLGALIAVRQLDPRVESAAYNRVFEALAPVYGQNAMYKGMKQEMQMLNNPKPAPGAAPEVNTLTANGKMAPEIALPDPKGKIRKLSDLKGKTVLIDFWASWCGPCRRENPTVVAAYNKYKKDGFEVFSVSLDKAKQPWIDAIAKDGLIWPGHVSDLKWWDSEAAEIYGITSIPKAFLVDAEGKIIGSDLRGPALEAKLQSIYGH